MLFVCLLASCIAVTQAQATVIDIPAELSGSVERNCISNTYSKSYGNLGYWSYWRNGPILVDRAFVQFRLDALPDTCVFLSAELRYYQYRHEIYLPVVSVTLVPRPDSLDAEELYHAILSGRLLAYPDSSRDGWMMWSLRAAPLTVLDSCRMTGKMSCGVGYGEMAGGNGYASGYQSAEAPYLHLVYVRPDEPDIQALHAELLTYPVMANGSDTALLTLVNKGLGASGPFWAYASLGLTRESTLVGPIVVGETASVRIALPSPPTPDVMTDYRLWATEDHDSQRYNDSTRLQCWSFPASTYAADGFDESGFPPRGWSVVDYDIGPHCWVRRSDSGESHSGAGFATCASESAGNSDDWLVSVSVCPDRDYIDSVGFFVHSKVRSVPDTLEVLAWNGQWPPILLLALDNSDTAYSRHSLSLDTCDGDTIQVAFRHRSRNGGNGLYLDDVWFSRVDTSRAKPPPRTAVQRNVPQLPELAFVLNPVHGGFAVVRCSLVSTAGHRLTLRNIAGSTVGAFMLDPSGVTSLDLHDFSPGVYFAALNAAGRPVTRKLVITAR